MHPVSSNIICFLRDITKQGRNRGKWFYTCKNDQCDYFVWSKDIERQKRKRGLYTFSLDAKMYNYFIGYTKYKHSYNKRRRT